jgi:hypothetical protein
VKCGIDASLPCFHVSTTRLQASAALFRAARRYYTRSSDWIFNGTQELMYLDYNLLNADIKITVTPSHRGRTNQNPPEDRSNGCLGQPAFVGRKPQYPNQAVLCRGNPTTSVV